MRNSSSAGLAACALFLCLAVSPAAPLHLFESVEPHMGTLFRIKLYAASPDQAKSAFRAAFARIARLDAALSDYRPESELNRVCRTAVAKPAAASVDLFRVLAASQKLAEETDGAFDVTLGPVIRLWRQARRDQRLPDAAALGEAAARCGYRKLHLDAARQTVVLDQPGMQLDLGGIAKGYAADAALEVLAGLGIRRALVAASGDLAFGDPPPGRPGWKIGLDSPACVLELANAAVSTSGDEEQHLDAGGRRYSHIIDPATSMALASPMAVTIVARRGVDADALATAVSVLGASRGLTFVEARPGVAGRIVTERVLHSSRWPGARCH
jgi:thiamine biosynthesis lipoprotein